MLPAIKYSLRKIIWLIPLVSFVIYGTFLHEKHKLDIAASQQKRIISLKDDMKKDVELPSISVCSRNQFSQRDADKVFEMEEWRNYYAGFFRMYWWIEVTLNASEAMSVFRNFAMHKMDPNEIEGFTQDQIDYLGHHRAALSKVIKFQVVPSCDELIIYCNYKGQDRECTDLFRIAPSYDGLCCTLQPYKIEQIKM